MTAAGLKACVISVSGGVDSAVTMALVSYAQKQKNSPIEKIIGLAQPIHSTEKIQSRAFLLEKFGRIITIDQTEIHDKLVAVVDAAMGEQGSVFARGQLKSYQRTPSADLWDGQTDEEELGISYDFIELFTEYLSLNNEEKATFKDSCSDEAWKEFEANAVIARTTHKRNAHKLNW